MGKPRARWQPYAIGQYKLGRLNGQAIVHWRSNERGSDGRRKRPRFRLYNKDGSPACSERDARAALAAWVAEQEALERVSAKTVAEIFKLFVADKAADGYSVELHGYHWKALEPTFGSLVPESITAKLCRDYAHKRFALGRAPSTVLGELNRLRSCMHWAKKHKIISEEIFIWVCKGSPPRDRVATREEILAMIEACELPHMRLYLILLLCTGGRTSAIMELTWDRVDFEKRTVDLNKVEVNTDPMNKSFKKGRAKVPMNNLLYQELRKAQELRETDHVIEFDGESIKSAKTSYGRVCKLAGVKGVTPHTLRHTGASWARDNDIPIEKVAEFLGHKNVKTTELIYTHPETGFTKPVADVLDLQLSVPLQKKIASTAASVDASVS